jgi:hypothetical protein
LDFRGAIARILVIEHRELNNAALNLLFDVFFFLSPLRGKLRGRFASAELIPCWRLYIRFKAFQRIGPFSFSARESEDIKKKVDARLNKYLPRVSGKPRSSLDPFRVALSLY